jgi:hypothetical protein
MVHAHSTSEVIAGLLLGAAGSAIFAAAVARSRHSYSAVILWQSGEHGDYPGASAEYGAKAPTQSLLGEIAVKIGPLEKPFTRADLHKRFY